MIKITIDDLPDDVAAELTVRAARRGQSLEEYVREYLSDLARRPDNAELMRLVRERKTRLGAAVSAEDIVRDIHDGRGRRGESRGYGDGPDALDRPDGR